VVSNIKSGKTTKQQLLIRSNILEKTGVLTVLFMKVYLFWDITLCLTGWHGFIYQS